MTSRLGEFGFSDPQSKGFTMTMGKFKPMKFIDPKTRIMPFERNFKEKLPVFGDNNKSTLEDRFVVPKKTTQIKLPTATWRSKKSLFNKINQNQFFTPMPIFKKTESILPKLSEIEFGLLQNSNITPAQKYFLLQTFQQQLNLSSQIQESMDTVSAFNNDEKNSVSLALNKLKSNYIELQNNNNLNQQTQNNIIQVYFTELKEVFNKWKDRTKSTTDYTQLLQSGLSAFIQPTNIGIGGVAVPQSSIQSLINAQSIQAPPVKYVPPNVASMPSIPSPIIPNTVGNPSSTPLVPIGSTVSSSSTPLVPASSIVPSSSVPVVPVPKTLPVSTGLAPVPVNTGDVKRTLNVLNDLENARKSGDANQVVIEFGKLDSEFRKLTNAETKEFNTQSIGLFGNKSFMSDYKAYLTAIGKKLPPYIVSHVFTTPKSTPAKTKGRSKTRSGRSFSKSQTPSPPPSPSSPSSSPSSSPPPSLTRQISLTVDMASFWTKSMINNITASSINDLFNAIYTGQKNSYDYNMEFVDNYGSTIPFPATKKEKINLIINNQSSTISDALEKVMKLYQTNPRGKDVKERIRNAMADVILNPTGAGKKQKLNKKSQYKKGRNRKQREAYLRNLIRSL